LTREARNDSRNEPTPRTRIEGEEIVPDWGKIKGLILHSGHKDRLREFVFFNITNAPGFWQGELDAEIEPADSGA
tara:strand:+ start:8010 stop:8234 length:225 start_codon:yes stop_codon:yes gene_type:complete